MRKTLSTIRGKPGTGDGGPAPSQMRAQGQLAPLLRLPSAMLVSPCRWYYPAQWQTRDSPRRHHQRLPWQVRHAKKYASSPAKQTSNSDNKNSLFLSPPHTSAVIAYEQITRGVAKACFLAANAAFAGIIACWGLSAFTPPAAVAIIFAYAAVVAFWIITTTAGSLLARLGSLRRVKKTVPLPNNLPLLVLSSQKICLIVWMIN